MKNLKIEEKEYLEWLTSGKPFNKNGYMIFQKQSNKKIYRVKRSRAVMQLHLNKKLEIWEHVHHKDEDRTNDSVKNLEVINVRNFDEHTSMHLAGKRGRKTTKGDFYKK